LFNTEWLNRLSDASSEHLFLLEEQHENLEYNIYLQMNNNIENTFVAALHDVRVTCVT
jgi:hypothetical protein